MNIFEEKEEVFEAKITEGSKIWIQRAKSAIEIIKSKAQNINHVMLFFKVNHPVFLRDIEFEDKLEMVWLGISGNALIIEKLEDYSKLLIFKQ